MFKLQHPKDLVSKMFILEYMRELSTQKMYDKANKYQKKELFYKFIDEESNTESIDINWEYCIFEATIYQLEALVVHFLDDIKSIDDKRKDFYNKQLEEKAAYEATLPTDINIMDMAATEIKKNNTSGFQLN